jgi:hypothetical protein
MNSVLSAVDKDLLVFVICLLLGGFVVVKFCVDQFEKPTPAEASDPWDFVILRYQTPRRQYRIGFLVYCGVVLLFFIVASLLPDVTVQIAKGVAAAATLTSPPAATTATPNYPTFPILVAFFIVSINSSLPKALDLETWLRRFAHRLAYIPHNMERVFNFMRFSKFDLPQEKLDAAWIAADLRRPANKDKDLENWLMNLNRTVVLYAEAGTLAGDLSLADAGELSTILNVKAFTLYREDIQNAGVSLQAIIARLDGLAGLNANDRMKAIAGLQRDLSRSLERLFAIFACAVAGRDMDRVSERVQAVGFSSPFPPDAEIPWNPILQAMTSAAAVLALSWWIAAQVLPGLAAANNIPTDTTKIVWLLLILLVVHLSALGQALRVRGRLIAREKYYSDSGKGQALAYVKILFLCAAVCFPFYLVLNAPDLYSSVLRDHRTPGASVWTALQILQGYFFYWLVWTAVPAGCGVMTAYTIDRPVDTLKDRIISGCFEGLVMAVAAVVALEYTTPQTSHGYRFFTLVLYGGLGFILAFVLPKAARRYWESLENRLPDKIGALRMSVNDYFYNIQQFTDWLTRQNAGLDGKRPLDVLAEDAGMPRLIALVGRTRTKTAAASG